MFDLISIGDSTIDVFLELTEAEVNCELVPHECKLILNYADKIPVSHMTRVAAVGNAANNAIGSARLGLKTALYTLVGDDADGAEMRGVLAKEGVAADYIATDTGKRSNFSAVILFQKERTILVYHEDRNYQLPQLVQSKWVYLTSVGKNHEGLQSQILDYVGRSGAKLAFQPGSHQLKDGKEKLRPVIAKSDMLIVNKREAQKLLEHDGEIPNLLKGLGEMGAKIVVITDGEKGSWSWDGQVIRFAEIIPETKLVERTGAGDAYSTGFLGAVILGKTVEEAMRWGTANASSVVEYVGAREGLLDQEGIIARINSCPECKVINHG